MRIVIDTNLLIDGAADDYNYGNRIIDEVIEGRLEAYANRATIRENMLLSSRKISDQEYLQKLNEFFASVRHAPFVPERLHVVSDEEDNKLVESAVAAQAEFLISSDKHLLSLGEYQGIQIVTPAEFWNKYQDETEDGWSKWIDSFMN
jgi:putative PIN family toxin of toxin-antitoxin system